ncbi:hypothetical protein Ciccas_003774 [Cichlidogyrus casuarinus]|uniref:YEATS domain-containing protein n=1 Tax=Cichlidogyrus casuarinus TaxID=1844966 RepID=A0ABD2QDE4_9PLAT
MDYKVVFVFKLGYKSLRIHKEGAEELTHRWKVYLDSWSPIFPLEKFVKKVTYHLHKTFSNPIQVRCEPPYELQELGFGSFQLKVVIHFLNRTESFLYDIDLYDNKELQTYQTVCLDPKPDEWIPFTKFGGIVIHRTENQNEVYRILKAIRLTSDINCLHPFSFVTRIELYSNSRPELKAYLEPLVKEDDSNGSHLRNIYNPYFDPSTPQMASVTPSNAIDPVNLFSQGTSCQSASSLADKLIHNQGLDSQPPLKLKQKFQLLHEAQVLHQEQHHLEMKATTPPTSPKQRIVLKLSRKSISTAADPPPISDDYDKSSSKMKKKKKKKSKHEKHSKSVDTPSSYKQLTTGSSMDTGRSIYSNSFQEPIMEAMEMQQAIQAPSMDFPPMVFDQPPSLVGIMHNMPATSEAFGPKEDGLKTPIIARSPDFNFMPLVTNTESEHPMEVAKMASTLLANMPQTSHLISPISNVHSSGQVLESPMLCPPAVEQIRCLTESADSPPLKDRTGIHLSNHLASEPPPTARYTIGFSDSDVSIKNHSREATPKPKTMSSNVSPAVQVQEESDWLKRVVSNTIPPHPDIISPLVLTERSPLIAPKGVSSASSQASQSFQAPPRESPLRAV